MLDESDSIESNILIVTNNAQNIKNWQEANYSVVYLVTVDCRLGLINIKNLPDQVWSLFDFEKFVNDNRHTKLLINEYIGIQRNQFNHHYGYTLNDALVHQLDKNIKVDLFVAGRYFSLKDVRNYAHTLSRAIIGYKNRLTSFSTALYRQLSNTMNDFISKGNKVDLITCVPSRPGVENRLNGVLNFLNLDTAVDFNLLKCEKTYPSPKKFKDIQDKFECVRGAFSCSRNINGNVVLIDDVLTSGVTVLECAKELYQAGASKVTVVTFGITQSFSFEHQNDMPLITDRNGKEYWIQFRNDNSVAFWGGRVERGREYLDLKAEYINSNDVYSNFSPECINLNSPNWPSNCNGIIFDLDNTLVNTDGIRYWRENRLSLTWDQINNYTQLIVDVLLLQKLSEVGITIGIVTNSPRNYAQQILAHYEIPYNVLIASGDTHRKKPHSEPMIKCANEMNIPPIECLNIGDHYFDIKAGIRAQMTNIGVINGESGKEKLEEIGCKYILNNIELEHYLEEILQFRLSAINQP